VLSTCTPESESDERTTAWHKMPTVPRAAAAWELPGLLALHTKAARRLHYYYVDVHAL